MNPMPWHEEAWQRLRQRRERNQLPHALMLSGPSGLGKRVFSERLQRALLCAEPVHGDACGHCRTCLLLDAGTHPDRVCISFEERKDGVLRKEIVVHQIRALSERLSKSSQFGGWQVACIDPADAMNASAYNALLKTLEEPTAASILILVADAPWRLPATIRSRCQRIEFRMPPRAEALQWLQAEGVEQAAAALDASAGNPGLARDWADGEALEQRKQVRADLAALAAGRSEPGAVATRWAGDAPEQRLWFAAQAVVEELRARSSNQPDVLHSTLPSPALAGWYAKANKARDALRGPLRNDLVVLELLCDWR
ncbi:DNA polymerase III subunit delta' [Oleiagrimonas sp.]|jgi:DNA polymerase-3 subunit delta'|uniref:DNA polymerase III subunit delta' n=1 Tax=Oleiagrimonas sp. TaxID=2010330 RepID=UPI0026121CF1|nr:DNA polymerase III subunit delta' [Oleiagrimonas sp.]MDA3914924.1 DNA polymerase III subunit delta' [Oleiagrimonas sp.]